MDLEPGHIYHVYNQGNNREKIFFRKENYHYFLKKIENHICPVAALLAWCLMPNHFHLIVALPLSDRVTLSHAVTQDHPVTLNSSIAVMLRSYTRAINIQENRSGSLFRERTKAEWLGSIESEKLKYENRNEINHETIQDSDEEYLFNCFRYIHRNPVKARLAEKETDWEFSSARDFAFIREGNLINWELCEQLGLSTLK
ncbi:MAG: hypothetical protein WCJ95_11210 [Mariniphaga sp.]